VEIFIAPVIVKPKAENQKEPRPEVEEKKNIYFQFNHTERRSKKYLKALDFKEPGHACVVVNADDALAQEFGDTEHGDG